MSDFTTISSGLASIVALGVLFKTYSNTEPKLFNQYPDYFIVYWIQLMNTPTTVLFLIGLAYARNELMRRIMYREMKEFLGKLFDRMP